MALAELDPLRLSIKAQVIRIVFRICAKAMLDGTLAREAARERDRPRTVEALLRKIAPEHRLRAKQELRLREKQ